jgi:hypothetical protein
VVICPCVCQTELGRFIYFLFAPTLIYRDNYPRSGNEVRERLLAPLGRGVNCVLLVSDPLVPRPDTVCEPARRVSIHVSDFPDVLYSNICGYRP